jgi:hypothetical protein
MAMGPAEVTGRTRQQLWKGLERIGVAGRARPDPGDLARAHATLDRFRREAPGRFFEGAAGSDAPRLIATRLPAARAEALAAAESAVDGRFDLLGYRGLSFGHPPDWHLDPVARRRAPHVHWTRLDPLDPAAVGDSKVIWELNRHQWLVALGQAYRLTGDERYAAHFARSIDSWLRANPPGVGINWSSSLELALRLIAWCWALLLFRDSRAVGPRLFGAMLGAVRAQATHVERYLSYYFSPNTHLTGEALGLFYVGVLFPELKGAGRWRALGRQLLIEESRRQILGDGVHVERATCYQRYTVEIYAHFALLAARNGVAVPPEVGQRLERLLEFLLAVRAPDGALPQIGDADGGWLLPLARRSPADVRGIFAIAAVLFARGDFAWAAGGVTPEVVWLLGAGGVEAFDALDPIPPADPPSRVFAEGGYAIMRDDWSPRAQQMVVDIGPLGCQASAGHGHADLLSVQCAAFGEPYLVDSGTYAYTPEPGWRDFFRSTAAHSTVTVDGLGQAAPRGPFAWHARPRANLRRWRAGGELELVDAEHDAYGGLADPVIHRRRVLWIKPRYWIVVDDLLGGGAHDIDLRFQFAPLSVTAGEAPWVRARGASDHGLLLRAFGTEGMTPRIASGETAPIQGWLSLDYGQRHPSPVVVYSIRTTLPLRIATLVFPIADARAAAPPVSPLASDAAGPTGLSLHHGREIVRFALDAEEYLATC